jgi:hypothetical protein
MKTLDEGNLTSLKMDLIPKDSIVTSKGFSPTSVHDRTIGKITSTGITELMVFTTRCHGQVADELTRPMGCAAESSLFRAY